MRITMLAVGTDGDVVPFLALGRALQARGHAVRLASPVSWAGSAHEAKLDFAPIGGDIEALLRSPDGGNLLASQSNPLRLMRSFARSALPAAEALLEDLWRAGQDAELLIYSLLTLEGRTLALKRRVPGIFAAFQPL